MAARRAGRGATRGVEYGPFLPPFRNWQRVPLRDRFSYSGVEPTTAEDWIALSKNGRGKQARIPLSFLHATQETIASDFADVAARNSSGELPMIVKERGKYYILDGHHRLSALQDSGADAANVMLFNSTW